MERAGFISSLYFIWSSLKRNCILCIVLLSGLLMRAQQGEPVRIGLLLPDSSSEEARYGAEFAVEEANRNGGVRGRKIELLTRSMEGPWGQGSKMAVDLVFEEKVWALLGTHQGRNAHLVEQVIAKTQILFLSAWAADPTLSQAFVPWYFSCVPDSDRQAEALAALMRDKTWSRWVLVTGKDYDSRVAAEALQRHLGDMKLQSTSMIYLERPEDLNRVLEELRGMESQAILLLGHPPLTTQFIRHLRSNKMDQPIYGTLSLLGEKAFVNARPDDLREAYALASDSWSKADNPSFFAGFRKRYGRNPSATAVYAYDGARLLIQAIRASGADREKLRQAMSEIRFEGITGTIRFDERGNRLGLPVFLPLDSEIFFQNP